MRKDESCFVLKCFSLPGDILFSILQSTNYYLQINRSKLFCVELKIHANWDVPVAFVVVCVSRYLWTLRSASRISAGIVFTFSDRNIVLRSFGVYPTHGSLFCRPQEAVKKRLIHLIFSKRRQRFRRLKAHLVITVQNTISYSSKREGVQTSASWLIGNPSTSSATTSRSNGDWFVNTFRQPIDQYIKICGLHLLLQGHETWKILKHVSAIFNRVDHE